MSRNPLKELQEFWNDPWEWNEALQCWHTRVFSLSEAALSFVPCVDFPGLKKTIHPRDYAAQMCQCTKMKDKSYLDKLAIAYRCALLKKAFSPPPPAAVMERVKTHNTLRKNSASSYSLELPPPQALVVAGRRRNK